jgi:hypothetical protein
MKHNLKELSRSIALVSSLAIYGKTSIAQACFDKNAIQFNVKMSFSKEELKSFINGSTKINVIQSLKPDTGQFSICHNDYELILHKKGEEKSISILPLNTISEPIHFKITKDSVYRFFIQVDNIYTEVFLEANFLLNGDDRRGKGACFESTNYVSFDDKKRKMSHGHCSHYSSNPK